MAINRDDEVRRLDESDVHIADSERRITAQIAIVEDLRRGGHDTAEAETMLATFESALETMRAHRALIVDATAASTPG